MRGNYFSRRQFEIFFVLFSRKMGFDISCNLSHQETISMKCQNFLAGKNDKKKTIGLSSAEFVQGVVKVKFKVDKTNRL